MKNTVKRILSIVLVVALFATLSITAFAAGTVTISTAPTTLYLSGTKTSTLAATCDCTTTNKSITWTSGAPTVVEISGTTATAKAVGSATLTATCTCDATETVVFTVKCCDTTDCDCDVSCTGACECDKCTTPTAVDAPATLNLTKNGTQALTATITYPSCCAGAKKTDTLTWSVLNGDDAVEIPSPQNGVTNITGKKYGTANVKVVVTDHTSVTDTMTVNVVPPAPTAVADEATVYAFENTAATLKVNVTATEGCTPKYEWYEGSSSTPISGATSATYEVPANKVADEDVSLSYTCKVYNTVNDGGTEVKSGATPVSFTVKPLEKYIVRIGAIASDSISINDYVELKATVKERVLEPDKSDFTEKDPTSTPTINWSVPADNTALRFSVSSSPATTATGSSVYVYGIASNTAGITVTAKYTNSSVDYTDTMLIKVQDTIEVTLISTAASVTVNNTTDAAKVYSVYDRTAQKNAYTTNPSSASNYYYEVTYSSDNTSVATVNSTTGVVTAVAPGTAKITAAVKVYTSSAKIVLVAEKEAECTITVTTNDFDICANLKSGATITFKDANFSDWYKKQTSESYYMSHVVLGAPSYAYGTFRNNGVAFAPNSTTLYTAGKTGVGYSYIANTTYTATTGPYYITVPFTCYGGATSTATNVSKTGTMYIFVNPGNVGTITYELGTAAMKTLAKNDFIGVYKTALADTSAYTNVNIKLLDVPENGDLYLGYYSAINPGTKITASNYSGYTFGASNYLTPTYSIDNLTYIPDTGAAGEDVIRYAVYDTTYGRLLYVARLVFDNGDSGYVSYAEGRTFAKTDFYSTSDLSPITSVKFAQPETGKGKLYTGYANGNGVLVTATDSFNTGTTVTAKDITTVTYIPPAGFTGNVTIKATATTAAGQTKDISFVITVKSKTASSVFTDVTAKNTGTWSANAIDYAYKWGLVNGTTTTAPLKYSPGGNMTRAQFVAVLYRAAGSPSTAGLTNPFTDIKKTTSTSWYYDAVLWAYHNKVVTGASATTFNPTGKLTREQLSKMLYGFDQVITGVTPTGGTTIYDYTDYAKVSSYAVDSIKWAVGKGIITSASATAKTINPQGTATRAQVATMLHRYLTK